MLPFVKPSIIRQYYPENNIDGYEDAVKTIIDNTDICKDDRNILIAHQFVTSGDKAPLTCESETISVGGLDNIDSSIFNKFDYVALGHLHSPQHIGSEKIRYGGSPLKYSFSEINQKKVVTIIEINKDINYKLVPLTPLIEMKQLKGNLEQLLKMEKLNDYIHVILTDEEELFSPITQLRKKFPNILKLDFENSRTKLDDNILLKMNDISIKTSFELFEEFFQKQNNIEMNNEQRKIVQSLMSEIENL